MSERSSKNKAAHRPSTGKASKPYVSEAERLLQEWEETSLTAEDRLADRALRLLEEQIVTLQLPPGSIWSEAALSARIKIGRTPVREAVQRLAADHFVVIMRRHGMPLAPLMIGMVLGPLAETSLRDALLSTNGNYAVFVSGPIPLVLYGLLLLVLAITLRNKIVSRTRRDI